jgi:integrase
METEDLILPKKEAKVRRTKNRKARPAFLLDDLVSGLITYLSVRPPWPGPELWLAFNKSRTACAGALSKTGLRLMLVRRCRRAQIRFVHPHLFRHGFAMEYLNNGADMKAVSTMLGHTTMRPTERHYAQWVDGPLRRVHQHIAGRISGAK